MPLDRDQAEHLSRLLDALRPEWDRPGIIRAVRQLVHRPETPEQIVIAAIRCEADPAVRTPLAIPSAGSHWNDGKPLEQKPPRLTPADECPRHPGQWEARCSPCAAERLAPPHDQDEAPAPRPDDGYDPSAATIGDFMRAEARRAAALAPQRFAELHPERTTDDIVHVVTDLPAAPTTPGEDPR